MCGITGYLYLNDTPEDADERLRDSLASLHHRGPDDRGLWQADGVGFGHARLSILDLSPLGHQPMTSADGQWVMVYNGEVYNFREIRAVLEARGHRFNGTGDSEVILAAFSEWGPDAVRRFVGMFAIALWHKPTRHLHLLRDRLGVKPLYYAWNGRRLLFGSELKAIRAFADDVSVDSTAMADFFRYGYINQPRTIYRKVFKLPQAHRLNVDAAGRLAVHRYWSALDAAERRTTRREEELTDELEALMIDAFRYRMISDVPVGVFLSGGIDSSVVAAVLQRHGQQRVKTYTIGFNEPRFDESSHARRVAEHLGTEHHSRTLDVAEAKRVLPQWGDLYDEPFGDASGIPTLLVSRVAAEEVKVVLSADGGDELFSGYSAYATALARHERLQRMPDSIKELTARVVAGVGVAGIDDWLAEREWPGGANHSLRAGLLTKARKVGERVRAGTIGEVFDQGLVCFGNAELDRLIGESAPTRPLANIYPGSPGEQLCLWDLHHFMCDDVLTKVDRATMAVSIEGREPLIDHRLVEFALSLPFALRRGTLGSKHLLRKVLYRYVPRELVDRPKQGFGVPIRQWLMHDLDALVDRHLEPHEMARQSLLDPAVVRTYVRRLRGGDHSVAQRVWLLLAFQMWRHRWM
jgi:asparagine synthase (glutamine-hydrolysing)